MENISAAFEIQIHRFLGESIQKFSKPSIAVQKTESKKMDSARLIPLAGLSMIFFLIGLSVRRNRNIPRRHAAERLFEAFKDEIQGLGLGTIDPYKILERAFPKHENAYIHFRPFLNGKVLREFDAAWSEYCRWREEDSLQSLEPYFAGGSQILGQERRQLALRKLLRFLSSVRMYSHLPPR